ncbi:MAG: hypothetical protein IAF58_19320, partial [Leptolyngbya sp.]|nr:hypothetical protein [Candidatus Melainabacteria bacterium]
ILYLLFRARASVRVLLSRQNADLDNFRERGNLFVETIKNARTELSDAEAGLVALRNQLPENAEESREGAVLLGNAQNSVEAKRQRLQSVLTMAKAFRDSVPLHHHKWQSEEWTLRFANQVVKDWPKFTEYELLQQIPWGTLETEDALDKALKNT